MIRQRHRESLAGLKAELETIQALRLRCGALSTELDNVQLGIDALVEERLQGGSSDSELAASGNRKLSLDLQLGHLRKHEDEALLSLQRRLTPDVVACERLASFWESHRLACEVRVLQCLVVEESRATSSVFCFSTSSRAGKSFQPSSVY